MKFATALVLALAGLAGLSPAAASAAWLDVADLAPANAAGKPVGAPSVAVARDGTAFAAFQRFDGANSRAAVAMRSPGGGFGGVRDLSPAGQDAFSPAIAVDRQGNATLAWMQGPAFVVQARFRPAGGDWGAVTPALSAGPISSGPSLAVGEGGAAVVAWGRRTGGQVARVEAAVRPAGAPGFGAALPISPDAGTGLCQPPRVAMDAAGDVAAIWTRRTSATGDFHVETAVKAAGAAAWDPSEPRSLTPGNSPCNSDIQMTPAGRITAVWDFTELSAATLPFAAFADRGAPFATGAWSAPVKLSVASDPSTKPLLALDGAGDAGATWISRGQILSAVRTGLGGFSPPKPLSGATELNGQAVAASVNGDALAAFVGTSNGNDAVFSARRRTGTDFGEVTPVAVTPPGGANVVLDAPDVALDDEGNGFAVWQRRVAGTDAFSAQVAGFDPVAPTITAADVPAAGVAGQAIAMSATAIDRMSGAALDFDFGDGSRAGGAAVQHVYAAAGAFTVTIAATDAAGNRSSTTRGVQIAPAPVSRPQPITTTGGGGPSGPRQLTATTAASWDRLRNGRTRMLTLVVEGLTGPETIRLACTGGGCRKSASRTVRKHGRKVDLTKAVKGMVLRPKAKLAVTVTQPDHVARIFTYAMVRSRDPKKSTRCLAPGAKKSSAC